MIGWVRWCVSLQVVEDVTLDGADLTSELPGDWKRVVGDWVWLVGG